MNVQPLSTVRIPTIVNPNLKAKTPTSEHRSGLRMPTTPTASTSTFTKIPTPTGLQSRKIKSGSGIASPSKGNSRVAPVSPNKSYYQKSATLGSYGSTTITGRKSATTPSKTSLISSADKGKEKPSLKLQKCFSFVN